MRRNNNARPQKQSAAFLNLSGRRENRYTHTRRKEMRRRERERALLRSYQFVVNYWHLEDLYIGLRFKSNPVLTLPFSLYAVVRSNGNNARSIVGQLILFFFFFFFLPLSRDHARYTPSIYGVTFLSCPLLSVMRYHPVIPFSFTQRLDSSYRRRIRVTSTIFPGV